MVTGFELVPPPEPPDLEVETFAVRTRRRLRLLLVPLHLLGWAILRYLGAPRGEGGATL